MACRLNPGVLNLEDTRERYRLLGRDENPESGKWRLSSYLAAVG